MKRGSTGNIKLAYTPVLHVKNIKDLRVLEKIKIEITKDKQSFLSNKKIEIKGLGVFSLD